MKKEIIETLILLTNNKIYDLKDYKTLWSIDSPEIPKSDKKITHLQECIDELNKLLKT